MRRILSASCAAIAITAALMAAQDRYVRAEENQNHSLVITTSAGTRIVLGRSDHELLDGKPVEFKNIGISDDGAAVGWVVYSPICCTSYPVPFLVEVYRTGTRHTFEPAAAPWHWCFVDGSASLATTSSPLHGSANEEHELWDIATGKKRDEFIWREGEPNPSAPSWVLALRRAHDSETHQCSTE